MSHLTYEEIQKRIHRSPLRQTEVPVEHAVSLPLPTLRAGLPGYACFAAPAVRHPGSPVEQGAPDRWWISDVRNGQTLVFAHCSVLSFHPGAEFRTEVLPKSALNLAEMQATFASLIQQLTEAAPLFFEGAGGDPALRQRISQLLRSVVPAPLLPQYQALAPDFFAWLEAEAGA